MCCFMLYSVLWVRGKGLGLQNKLYQIQLSSLNYYFLFCSEDNLKQPGVAFRLKLKAKPESQVLEHCPLESQGFNYSQSFYFRTCILSVLLHLKYQF